METRYEIEQILSQGFPWQHISEEDTRKINDNIENVTTKILNTLGICGSCGQKIKGKE